MFLDGEFVFGLPKLLAAQLEIGRYLTAAEIEALQQEGAVEAARQRALGLIARRPRSEKELRQYFDRREVPTVIQDVVIERLAEAELVDDFAFAESWVENRTEFRPRGEMALKAELRQKGVSRMAIEDALVGFDEEAAALKAGEKALSRYRDLEWEDFRQRVGAYLGRRGFRFDIISSVVDRLWRQVAKDESEGVE
ncbi:MAG: regulatory protein RecX [Anaerolineales bacterium]